ncbi:uncharacterized protein V1518DRAFT_423141 [Limtongia smithiae]|uniref:uncharacterized protein n=1 Tax=Limtongia smithiae TaxID=1125753 RepID=UPI0034CFD2DB
MAPRSKVVYVTKRAATKLTSTVAAERQRSTAAGADSSQDQTLIAEDSDSTADSDSADDDISKLWDTIKTLQKQHDALVQKTSTLVVNTKRTKINDRHQYIAGLVQNFDLDSDTVIRNNLEVSVPRMWIWKHFQKIFVNLKDEVMLGKTLGSGSTVHHYMDEDLSTWSTKNPSTTDKSGPDTAATVPIFGIAALWPLFLIIWFIPAVFITAYQSWTYDSGHWKKTYPKFDARSTYPMRLKNSGDGKDQVTVFFEALYKFLNLRCPRSSIDEVCAHCHVQGGGTFPKGSKPACPSLLKEILIGKFRLTVTDFEAFYKLDADDKVKAIEEVFTIYKIYTLAEVLSFWQIKDRWAMYGTVTSSEKITSFHMFSQDETISAICKSLNVTPISDGALDWAIMRIAFNCLPSMKKIKDTEEIPTADSKTPELILPVKFCHTTMYANDNYDEFFSTSIPDLLSPLSVGWSAATSVISSFNVSVNSDAKQKASYFFSALSLYTSLIMNAGFAYSHKFIFGGAYSFTGYAETPVKNIGSTGWYIFDSYFTYLERQRYLLTSAMEDTDEDLVFDDNTGFLGTQSLIKSGLVGVTCSGLSQHVVDSISLDVQKELFSGKLSPGSTAKSTSATGTSLSDTTARSVSDAEKGKRELSFKCYLVPGNPGFWVVQSKNSSPIKLWFKTIINFILSQEQQKDEDTHQFDKFEPTSEKFNLFPDVKLEATKSKKRKAAATPAAPAADDDADTVGLSDANKKIADKQIGDLFINCNYDASTDN